MQQDINLQFGQRLAAIERGLLPLEKTIETHDQLLTHLDKRLDALGADVKQIRNALYLMAVAVAANVPVLQELAKSIAIVLQK